MNINLTEKQKILLRTAGMTAAVYLVFKYLIPLLIPFLIAILLSIPIRPLARFFYRKFHVPIGVSSGILLALLGAFIAGGLFWLGKSALEQLSLLWRHVPSWWQGCCDWLLDCCDQMEQGLQLSRGTIRSQVVRFTDMGEGGLGAKALAGVMDGIMSTSFQGIRIVIELLVTVFVTIGATLITTTQLEEMKRAIDRSRFREEICRITKTLARVGAAYGKTQLLIMLLTMGICIGGLTIMGNSYPVLLGILIGLLDALPIFGVGTVAVDCRQRTERTSVADCRIGGDLWDLQPGEGIDGGPVYGGSNRADRSGKSDLHVCGNAAVWSAGAVSGAYGVSADQGSRNNREGGLEALPVGHETFGTEKR